MNNSIWLFFYLNVLDVATTALGYRSPGDELNPIYAWMFRQAPGHIVAAMLLYKGLLFALVACCGAFNKYIRVKILNIAMGFVVLWNLAGLLAQKFGI